ncbi:XtrA/YqaO family protein [Planococcus dechangensis]|uniref:XtrA/YqaO family protein n=1 Tax=Planococcus dechangensis TaxID=1176255 RepID=A0ABV9MA83_9BACL
MRLQDVKISETGILELDIMELPERCFLVIDQGKARYAELHPHAETKIITNKGKVARVRFEEGEDF